MEEITLGQIKDIIIFLTALFGGIGVLYGMLMKGIRKLLDPINQELENEKRERLKSDLTTFMYLAEFGNLSNEQKIRAHEEYDMYVEMKGNSWVHDKFETLKKENKI